jgi:4-amino-4-deoxy-L-arabinose transferase-like glycosyltransferase
MSQIEDHNESPLEKENLALKQKIDELERTLSNIETGREITKDKVKSSPWWMKALFLLTLALGAIPVYFVVQDRWYEHLISIKSIDDLWWSISALRTLAYPRYFLIIFASTTLTALVVFFWRNDPRLVFSNLRIGTTEPSGGRVDGRQRQMGRYLLMTALLIANISAVFVLFQGRIPGWELVLALVIYVGAWILMEYPIDEIKMYFEARGRFLLSAAIFVIALCSALYAAFGESKPNLIFFLLLIFAGINFLGYQKETPVIFWISAASLVALTWKIDSWAYVVIGDEYSFYNEVRNILENRTAWELINTTFNGNFVYGTHPYFSSYLQSFFMKMFDNHNFGWRFSNPFLVAGSLFFFFYFFKAFIPRRTALITVILLGFSHYLLSFSKIGYNNLQSFFALGLVLATFTWALQSKRIAAFSLLGLSMGLCFYIYPAALYIIPIPILGLLIYLPPNNKNVLKYWGWVIISMSLLIYPLVAQPRYWEAKIPGTFLYTEVSGSAGELARNTLVNMLYSSLSFLYVPEQSHYVSNGYMDPLSSIFIVIGFAYLAKLTFSRNKSALFLGLSFLTMFVIVGATHGRNFPTATRMFLLLPWFALFTAFGLEWCAEKAETLFNGDSNGLIRLATGLIVVINLFHAYVIDIRNMPQYHSLAPMFVKTVREISANSQIPQKSYAFVAPPNWDTSGIEMIQRVYLVPDSPRQLMSLPLEGSQLPESAADLAGQRDIVVIVKADIDGNIITQVDAQLQAWGKSMCEIRNEKGTLQFQLWHSGDLGWLCE